MVSSLLFVLTLRFPYRTSQAPEAAPSSSTAEIVPLVPWFIVR